MRTGTLASTGVEISRVALGTAFFGTHISQEESGRILDRALALGINVVDTAESYLHPEPNTSERVLGDLLRGRRHEVLLASKVSPQRPWAPHVVNRGLSRRAIMQAVEGSLGRLQTDHLDLLYAHGPHAATPLEETLAAFDDLVRAGKIRYAGLSNHSAAQVTEALWMAERHHLRPIAATQDLYNLLERDNEQELYPACRRHGVGTFAYAPLAGGLLSGKYAPALAGGRGTPPPETRAAYFGSRTGDAEPASSSPKLTERTIGAAARVRAWAEARGHSGAQVALAWVLGNPDVSAAILGVATAEQLESNTAAFDLELSPDERDELVAVVDGDGPAGG